MRLSLPRFTGEYRGKSPTAEFKVRLAPTKAARKPAVLQVGRPGGARPNFVRGVSRQLQNPAGRSRHEYRKVVPARSILDLAVLIHQYCGIVNSLRKCRLGARGSVRHKVNRVADERC